MLLTGLQPGTMYTYVVGFTGTEGGGNPQKFSFRTAPSAAAGQGGIGGFTAVVLGDMGVNNSAATLAAVQARIHSYNFTIHVGDISYADDSHLPLNIEPSSGRSYEAVYDLYQRMTEPLASTIPYMVAPGNHDVTCHVTGDEGCPVQQRNFSAYRYRYRMPASEAGVTSAWTGDPRDSKPQGHASQALRAESAINSHHNMWYSWRAGAVHFVSLDTESDFPHAPSTPHTVVGGGAAGGFGDQLGWLRSDLAAARSDPTVTWIVAFGHRPWYATDDCKSCGGQACVCKGLSTPALEPWRMGHVH